jgi:uncharacterized protein (TIGR02145 family)
MNLSTSNRNSGMEKLFLSLSSILLIVHGELWSQISNIFKDPRDGQIYKTIIIGQTEWYAQNQNFPIKAKNAKYWVPGNKKLNNSVYGKLYNWIGARKSCPKHWRLPEEEDWIELIKYFGGDTIVNKEMQSNFSVLLAGYRTPDAKKRPGIATDFGKSAYFWTDTYWGASFWHWHRYYTLDSLISRKLCYDVDYGYSVRCVRKIK